ncbi:Mss4-like protein [Aspergillus leporis]|uniref:Mss4-like protein n=1 Tax=Aspergillus leporis TaxID=41062 RepID=A0A5N5WRU6_9EURO|nr:Mss4-like protein [Aspergillus leporis]
MATNIKHPSKITGGCLCGAVRYTVHFTGNSSWPPKSSSCQCTMCRKWTASLFPQMLSLASEQVTPELSTFQTYKEYRSSEKCLRGFCSECGSSLIFRSEETPKELHVFLGTIDEKWLIGEKVKGTEKLTERGVAFERDGGLGGILGTPSYVQIYYENAVPGVTDILGGGKKYLGDDSDWDGFD